MGTWFPAPEELVPDIPEEMILNFALGSSAADSSRSARRTLGATSTRLCAVGLSGRTAAAFLRATEQSFFTVEPPR